MSFARAAPLRIIHIEDVPADAELAERELLRAEFAFETRRVETREAFLAALQDFAPDLILSDYRLPEFDGMQALLLANEHAPDVPVIITTGSVNEETAVACMKAGAADYVLKEQLGRLGTAVRSALEKQRLLAERKRAEGRIRQLNRLLKTISEVNQLIVRTDDRQTLLSGACRILVEHGGFRMAWVGLADREKGLVLPAARAGDAAHYLDQITVRFDETPEGRGPVGAAIRTERHVVVVDLAAEPTVAPWRERMLAHGFRTVGVFPFRVRGEVAGTLTVYLPEPGAIGDEETTLLDELAADLGYALETLEIRDERKRAEEALAKSEQKLRAFFDSGVIGMVFADLQGHVLAANDEYLRIIGYTRKELQVGEIRWDRLTDPEYLSRDVQGNAEARERGACKPYEKQYIRTDGTKIWVLVGYVVLQPERELTVAFVLDISRRKRMEDEIRGSEERYRLLFDSNPHAMLVYDRESLRILAVNDTAVVHYGYSREEVLSMTVPDLLDTGVRANLVESSRNVPGFVRQVGVWPVLRKDGSIVDAEITTHDLLFDGREARLVLAVDITERKRVEEALRASQKTLRVLLDASPDVVILLDTDGRLIAGNQVLAEEFGKEIRELIGHSPFDLMPADAASYRRERVKQVIETGRLVRDREERSGRFYDVILAPIKDEGGHVVVQVAIFVREVTDLERARMDLAKSELYYRSLLEHSLDITVVLSPEGNVRYVSSSVERVLGYRPEELGGTNVFGLVHPEDQALVQSKVQRVLETGSRFETVEARFRHRDGSFRVLSVIGKLLPPEIEERGLIVSARDLTDRQQLEAQLLQAQKMEAVGRLAGGVAHDFNNLLTVIQGYGEMLSTSLGGDETRREQVGEILKAAERAAALTHQLLAFSRRQALEMRVLDLGAAVGETEKMLRRLIGEDVELVVVKPREPVLVKADSGQIEQVLMNLAVNARDAMPGGGRLVVELSEVHLGEELAVMPEPVPAGHWAVLTVGDNGTGMDAETLSHVFEPFFTTKETGKGTGLGLATVYGIVKQSGGLVTVASEPGQGTTFRVFLPRAERELSSEPDMLATGTGGAETILLVEDEPGVRGLICRLLEGRGYRVLAAESGAAALAMVDRHEGPIPLLVTDLVMPGLNGRELAAAVVSRRPGTRVLFISAYPSGVLSRRGLRESGARFLQKPFTEAALARSVRGALDAPAPASRDAKPDT